MSKVKTIVQWVLVAILAILASAWFPTVSSLLFLLALVLVLPVKQVEQALEKFRLKFAIRIVIAVILFLIGAVNTPDKTPFQAKQESAQDSSSSSDKKNDEKDAKKDNNEDVKAQIIDTWHYGTHVLDSYFTFSEDGTWIMGNDGGSWNRGTYEIIDGKTIKMKGEIKDRTFKIRNADELEDEDGETLTRYVREPNIDLDEDYEDDEDYEEDDD